MHKHLGEPLNKNQLSESFRIPPTDFEESDFLTLFEPSGKVQGPKLRAAMKSLRLAQLSPEAADKGIIRKIGQSKERYRAALKKDNNSSLVDRPSQPFDVSRLIPQIIEECHYVNGNNWGNRNDAEIGYCSSLFTRIQSVVYSPSFHAVFGQSNHESLDSVLSAFLGSDKQVLRLCLSSTSYEFNAREILANAIGRKLLSYARGEKFIKQPLLAIVDEAHNFLGKRIGLKSMQ